MVCSFVSTRVYACTLDVLGALPWPPEYIQWRCLHEALVSILAVQKFSGFEAQARSAC